jgi:hypothetical protein
MLTIDLKLTTPQIEFYDLQCKYPLFIGGYGSGKTEALLSCVLRDILLYPSARIGIYVPVFDQIRLNIAPRLVEKLSMLRRPVEYNRSEQLVSIKGLPAQVIMRSMDNPARIVGYEVFRSHIDEMETMRPEQTEDAWTKIIARNRQKAGGANQVRVYTTPDAGFGFTHRNWAKQDDPDYQYIRAPSYSNPHLPADYVDSLRKSYSPDLAEAFIEGIWCNINSGSVYPSFDRVRNASSETVRGSEQINVGMDFNVQRGCAVIFVKRGHDIHAVDEIHNAYDTPEQIRILKERYPHNPIVIYPDQTGRNRKSSNATETDFTQLKTAGFRVREDFRVNMTIKERVQATNSALYNEAGEARVFVNVERCPHLTTALEQQCYTENGTPDKSPPNYDDIADAFGYHVAREFPIKRQDARITMIHGGY